MCIYIMNDHYIQNQQYNEYMNELENLSNINYQELISKEWALFG
jgi:hypothetical protein